MNSSYTKANLQNIVSVVRQCDGACKTAEVVVAVDRIFAKQDGWSLLCDVTDYHGNAKACQNTPFSTAYNKRKRTLGKLSACYY